MKCFAQSAVCCLLLLSASAIGTSQDEEHMHFFETGDWRAAADIPLLVPSPDFLAVKLQLQAMAAEQRKDPSGARNAAEQLARLAKQPGQHPFVQQIITMQAKEAAAFAAEASGNGNDAIAKMKEAVAIEDSIDSLSQPPYPIMPANELLGSLLLNLNRPGEAMKFFLQTLQRMPGRPMAIYGAARAAEANGDKAAAEQHYREFLSIWKGADAGLPQVATAKEFLAEQSVAVANKK
jgi:tetratricopeptide (TPR) repeat protein